MDLDVFHVMITLVAFHQVTTHHEQLLIQAAGVTNLADSLHSVRSGLSELDASLEKYRNFQELN